MSKKITFLFLLITTNLIYSQKCDLVSDFATYPGIQFTRKLHQLPEYKLWLKENKIKEIIFNSTKSEYTRDDVYQCEIVKNIYHENGELHQQRYYYLGMTKWFSEYPETYQELLNYLKRDSLWNSPVKNEGHYLRMSKDTILAKIHYDIDANGELIYISTHRSINGWPIGGPLGFSLDKTITYDRNSCRIIACDYFSDGSEFFGHHVDTGMINIYRHDMMGMNILLKSIGYRIGEADETSTLDKWYSHNWEEQELTLTYAEFEKVFFDFIPNLSTKTFRPKQGVPFRLGYVQTKINETKLFPDNVSVYKHYLPRNNLADSVLNATFTFNFHDIDRDSIVVLNYSEFESDEYIASKVIQRDSKQRVVLIKYYLFTMLDSLKNPVLQNAYGYDDSGNLIFHETVDDDNFLLPRIRIDFIYDSNGNYYKDELLIRRNNDDYFSDDPKWKKQTYNRSSDVYQNSKYSRVTEELESIKNEGTRIEFVYY